MPDVWVVNASPLIALAHAGRLELLEEIPDELVVPEAVVEEILAGPEDPAGRSLASGWGPRRVATVPEKVAEWGLGKGESAVIALALEFEATAVLDDRAARRCATALERPVIGTLGVIVRAKREGFIAAAAPVIRAVVAAGFYYSEHDIRQLLDSIDERWA